MSSADPNQKGLFDLCCEDQSLQFTMKGHSPSDEENAFHDSQDEYVHEGNTSMRMATEDNRSMRRKSRRDRILARRGAFHSLPVFFSNDLVHGSWWFVIGSIIATVIPVVPLVDLFYPFWTKAESSLPLLEDGETFGLLIISGFFFTLGSLAFVRATEEPPLKPLFTSYHLQNDELLAAWLFLLATIPFVPFMAVYVYYNTDVLVYWGCLVVSVVFVIATYFFVLSCYPTEEARHQIVPHIVTLICGDKCWVYKHLSNDWLAAMWVFFWGTLVMLIGSAVMLYLTIQTGNHLEIFDWVSSTVDSVVFLIGSAYFCAGSYPQENIPIIDEKTGIVTDEVEPLIVHPIQRKDRGV